MSNSYAEKHAPLKILVVEDNNAVAQNIADFLSSDEYLLDFAHNGKQGLKFALENYYDVIVLDLMLPGIDGLEVCQKIRENAERHIPILMLTARDTLDDKLVGFNVGADDYLTKPFALEELKARCFVLANRQKVAQPKTIKIGDIEIDRQRHLAKREGKTLELQRIPFQILLMLVESHPRTVSRSELWSKIWGESATDSDAIRSHVYQLRLALDKPFDTPLLATVHGVGFKLKIND